VLLGRAGWAEWGEGARGWGFFLTYGLPLVFCLAVVGVLVWLRLTLAGVQKRLKDTMQIEDVWHDLARLTVHEALMMVELRVGSLLALTSSVFMKRIRGLVFGDVTHDPAYEGRWMANFIYALELNWPKLWSRHPWLRPSDALRKLAKDAEAYPTTLWFDKPAQMDMVARVGEATTCYILLKFMVENREAQLADPRSPASELFARLKAEWETFNGRTS
jgi:hypothetical protein